MLICRVKRDCYRDSVFLMRLAKDLLNVSGVADAAIMMGTETNKAALRKCGLLSGDGEHAGPTDLIIAIRASTASAAESAVEAALTWLDQRNSSSTSAAAYATLELALAEHPEANIALISVPGDYAASEARRALGRGLHVMLFSDNVPLDEEAELKRQAALAGLLMMGPDCGTAIIDGTPLGFANVVRRGDVGVVAAAGTGLQEVTTLLDRAGFGISQAIGTGTHDLSDTIGAAMMLQGIDRLEADPATRIIVVVSKPPAPHVAEKVVQRLARCAKPTVVNFLGYAPASPVAGPRFATFLEDVVTEVAGVARCSFWLARADVEALLAEQTSRLGPAQKAIRGLFAGGTFCYEAQLVLEPMIGPVASNAPVRGQHLDSAVLETAGHIAVDLGDDEFTRGRPHPMIEPALRNRLVVEQAARQDTAVILADVLLGYGSHADPAGQLAAAIRQARAAAQAQGRDVSFVVSVCGTSGDPQDLAKSEAKLREAGAAVLPTNAQAARFAGLVVNRSALPADAVCSTPFSFRPSEFAGPATASHSSILGRTPFVINVGVRGFYDDLVRAGARAVHVDWRPAAGGDRRLVDVLARIM